MKRFIRFLIFLSLLASVPLLAREFDLQDSETLEIAKGKLYLNGAEEGELRVQGLIIKPQRKISPVIEKRETESESSADRD